MPQHKQLIYIIKTNWLHLLGIFLCTEIVTVIYAFYNRSDEGTLVGQILFSAPFLIFTYGLLPLIAFYMALLVLDLLCFSRLKLQPLAIVLIEWVIIVPIFIYWALIYEYWLWLALISSFLVTQLIRSRWISRRLQGGETA